MALSTENPGGSGIGSGEPVALSTENPGGSGIGSGEPVALSTENPGGSGIGSGEPVALSTENPGGSGIGSGEPVALSTENPGGLGIGSGEPVALSTENPGGLGIGSGEPVRAAKETESERLLDNCLTDVLTGSTIKTAQRIKPKRIERFFSMDEPSWVNHEGQKAVLMVMSQSVPTSERALGAYEYGVSTEPQDYSGLYLDDAGRSSWRIWQTCLHCVSSRSLEREI